MRLSWSAVHGTISDHRLSLHTTNKTSHVMGYLSFDIELGRPAVWVVYHQSGRCELPGDMSVDDAKAAAKLIMMTGNEKVPDAVQQRSPA